MSNKPSIPKGTRDFSPEDKAKRNYIFDTIKSVYTAYGYREIETPAMELLSTLTGKYGDEGDKLLFRILNSGDALKDFEREELLTIDPAEFAARACDRGLRYDLTVPFARYVVQHRNEITLPFKRFQIAPVWRADRPQKGRYREFYQCDADVIGSDSLLNEVELVQIMDEVFSKFGIRVAIKINNRKLLTAIAEVLEIEHVVAFTVAIDKIDKIGWAGVVKELSEIGVSEAAAEQLEGLLTMEGSVASKLDSLEQLLGSSEIGRKGIEELRYIFEQLTLVPTNNSVELDISLARGLDYYTGAIFEVKALDVEIGSITGGGRYDDLTGVFGVSGMSGVGISFGADRIFDVLNALALYPADITSTTKLLFVNFGSEEVRYILPIIRELRRAGVTAELYPDEAKLKKQLSYANSHKIPFVAFVGAEEIEKKQITIKDMEEGSQKSYSLPELLELFSKKA